MKGLALMTFVLFLFLVFGGILSKTVSDEVEAPETVEIYFFHDTACGACDGTAEFQKIVSEQIYEYLEEHPYKLNMNNVFQKDGRHTLEYVFGQYGLSTENLRFPLMMIEGTVYEGLDAIEQNILEAYLGAAGVKVEKEEQESFGSEEIGLFEGLAVDKQEATVVYFYREDCQECIDTKPFMESLPQSITVNGKEVKLNVIWLNSRSESNRERVLAFFDAYDVPKEDQMVPIVFLRDRYLAGQENIEEDLKRLLEVGFGLGFELP